MVLSVRCHAAHAESAPALVSHYYHISWHELSLRGCESQWQRSSAELASQSARAPSSELAQSGRPCHAWQCHASDWAWPHCVVCPSPRIRISSSCATSQDVPSDAAFNGNAILPAMATTSQGGYAPGPAQPCTEPRCKQCAFLFVGHQCLG